MKGSLIHFTKRTQIRYPANLRILLQSAFIGPMGRFAHEQFSQYHSSFPFPVRVYTENLNFPFQIFSIEMIDDNMP